MRDKQQLIDKLTGIQASRKSYYSELTAVVEEMKKKNKQMEVINRLTRLHVDQSWEEVASYLASQLSQVIAFDMFALTLIDRADLLFFISEADADKGEWSCRSLKQLVRTDTALTMKRFEQLLSKEMPNYYGTTVSLHNQAGRTYGFLTLLNRDNVEYATAELELYKSIAEHVRVSIENILLYKDVSEKIKIEAQLVQSAKLAALGEMAAGIAHELNSPLTVILGNVQLLMRELSVGRPGKMLEDIYQCGLRSKKIIQNLLTFSRQDEYHLEPIQLAGLIEDTLGLVGYQLAVSGISIKKQMDETLPPVTGSRNQIEQVLINLLLNARDAVQGKADPEVTVGTCLAERDGRCFVSVYVKDNGVGIEEEHMAHIFNPFFTTKESMKGTGLGLSVSLGIAEAHGGKLLVDSKVHEYSRFSLLLPIPNCEGADEK